MTRLLVGIGHLLWNIVVIVFSCLAALFIWEQMAVNNLSKKSKS